MAAKRSVSSLPVLHTKKQRVLSNVYLSGDVWRYVASGLDALSFEALRQTSARLKDALSPEKPKRPLTSNTIQCCKYAALEHAKRNLSVSQFEWVWFKWKPCRKFKRHIVHIESAVTSSIIGKFLLLVECLPLLHDFITRYHLTLQEDIRSTLCFFAADDLDLLQWLSTRRMLHVKAAWAYTRSVGVLEWLLARSRHSAGAALRRRINQLIEERVFLPENLDLLIWLLEKMKCGDLDGRDYKELITRKMDELSLPSAQLDLLLSFLPTERKT